ncbi:MAG TPA: DinB family protein [Capsulimonadaceae bacterium]|nr:DinB family protein [Capsulimonadaceae bacterium]
MPTDKLSLAITTVEMEVRSFAENLTPAQWLWRPETGEWSMAQCLDHLVKVGFAALPGMEAAITKIKIEGRRAPGQLRPSSPGYKPPHLIVYNPFDHKFVEMMSPNPPMKVPVPKRFLPSQMPAIERETLPQFFKLQERLQTCLDNSEGLDTLGVKVGSPVMPALKFSLAAFLEGTIQHQRYHWLQAKAVRARKEFPG